MNRLSAVPILGFRKYKNRINIAVQATIVTVYGSHTESSPVSYFEIERAAHSRSALFHSKKTYYISAGSVTTLSASQIKCEQHLYHLLST